LEADEAAFSFTILVQLGTLVALMAYFWKDLWDLASAVLLGLWHRRPFDDPQARLGWYIILGTFPALLVGWALKPLVEQLFRNPAQEAIIRLLLTAILLLLAEILGRRNRGLASLGWMDALWVGCAQALAVFPGASRSGATIAGGMTRHFDRPAAARFGFLLSIPVMLAASGYEIIDLLRSQHLGASFLPSIFVGMLTAAVVGFLAIHWLLSYLSRRPLYIFSIYCTLLGAFVLVILLV
jgi:undecaprenyl-diphosphatase